MEKASLLFVQSMVAAAVETLNGIKKVLAEMENAPPMPASIPMPNFNEMLSGLSGTPLMKPDLPQDTFPIEIKAMGDSKRVAAITTKRNSQPYISMSVISPKIKSFLDTKGSASLAELTHELFLNGDIPEDSKKTKSYIATALSLMKKKHEVESTEKYKGRWKLTKPDASSAQQENNNMGENLSDKV